MDKTTKAITSHEDWDYELIEHTARALEHSTLHVAGALTFVAVPEEIGGDPNDELSSVGLNIALVTDWKRGWLALVEADDECDWGQVAEELIEDLYEEIAADSPAPCIGIAANSYRNEELAVGALDLRRDRTRRIEEAFEARFADRPTLAPDAFQWMNKAMAACNYGWLTEAQIRETMNESPAEGLQARRQEESGVHSAMDAGGLNRQERRKQKAIARKKNKKKRRA